MKLKLDWSCGRALRQMTQKTQTGSKRPGKAISGSWRKRIFWSAAIALSGGAIALSSSLDPVLAAERVKMRLGPFHQSVAVSDLEEFAKTGKVPRTLKHYQLLLTPQFRETLKSSLQLDPKLGDKVVKDLLRSPVGKELIEKIGVALPDSNIEKMQAALSLAVKQRNGLSVISFLQAYPAETITLDASSAIAIVFEFNAPYWESKALSLLLERELTVAGENFSPAFNPAAFGSERVHKQTRSFYDRRRDRKIIVDLYWANSFSAPVWKELPEVIRREAKAGDQGDKKDLSPSPKPQQLNTPLVVISHGFGADRSFLGYLARHLASHGVTVAAIEHPGSNASRLFAEHLGSSPVGLPGLNPLLPASEFIATPEDVSFLLDRLKKLNQKPGSLQGKLNTEKVTAIGHSLGGYTALALAGAELNLDELRSVCKNRNPLLKSGGDWLQCAAADLPEKRVQLRDRRIAGAIALNPVIGQLFGKTGLAQVATPTLILTGTDDNLTPALNHQLRPFRQLPNPKYLITAIGGTHLSISDFSPGSQGEVLTRSTLVNERTGMVATPMRQLLQGIGLSFVKQLTPAAPTYEPFLSPAYTQSFSTPKMPLRFNTQLPASILSWLSLSALP